MGEKYSWHARLPISRAHELSLVSRHEKGMAFGDETIGPLSLLRTVDHGLDGAGSQALQSHVTCIKSALALLATAHANETVQARRQAPYNFNFRSRSYRPHVPYLDTYRQRSR